MEWRVFAQTAQTNSSLKVWVDSEPDIRKQNYFIFKPDRIVTVYYYLPGFAGARVFRTLPDSNQVLPHVEGPVKLLISTDMRRVARVKKLMHTLRKNNVCPDSLPDQFFTRFDLLIMKPKFQLSQIADLYEKYKNLDN